MRGTRVFIVLIVCTAAADAQGDPRRDSVQVCRPTNPPQCTPTRRGAFVPGNGSPWFEFMVDTAAAELADSKRPQYPQALRDAKISGSVAAQFVVDTLGRIEGASFKILASSHEAFSDAVREAAPEMRYKPAIARGRKVRQIVQQEFLFKPTR